MTGKEFMTDEPKISMTPEEVFDQKQLRESCSAGRGEVNSVRDDDGPCRLMRNVSSGKPAKKFRMTLHRS